MCFYDCPVCGRAFVRKVTKIDKQLEIVEVIVLKSFLSETSCFPLHITVGT